MDSSCGGLLAMNSEKFLLTVPFEPAAVTVNDVVMLPVGVPNSTPAELNVKPLNPDDWDVLQVHEVPQFGADSVWLYGTPTTPTGSAPPVVIANRSTVSVNDEPNVFDAVSVSVMFGKK